MLCATDNCNYVCPIIIMCKKTLKYNSTVIGRRYYAYWESLVPLINKISCSKRRNILNTSNVGCFWLAIGKCAHNMNQYRFSYENGSYYPCNFRPDLYFVLFVFLAVLKDRFPKKVFFLNNYQSIFFQNYKLK